MAKKEINNGLGKSLSELLDDNSEITNMRSNVLLHKNDGNIVKIYDKTGGKREENKPSRVIITPKK